MTIVKPHTGNATDAVALLSRTWTVLFPDKPLPTGQQWEVWLCLHDFSTVKRAIGAAGMRYQKADGAMTLVHIIKFASSVMNSLEEREHKNGTHADTEVIKG